MQIIPCRGTADSLLPVRPGIPPGYRSPVLFLLSLLIHALVTVTPGLAGEDGTGMAHHQGHDDHQNTMQAAMQQQVDPAQWVEEKTGQYIPLDDAFKNEKGETVTLREIIDRPTLLLPVYYYCPRACSFDLANLADAVARTSRPYGSFKVIAVSFNEIEPPEAAATAKPNYTELLPPEFDRSHWPFLTGPKDAIVRLTGSIGYTFKKQNDHLFIHPSAMVALDKDGRIIKYVYGSFLRGDVDLALAEAGKGTPATSIKRFLAFCFNYSPQKSRTVFTLLKAATVVLLAGGLFYFIFFILRKKN